MHGGSTTHTHIRGRSAASTQRGLFFPLTLLASDPRWRGIEEDEDEEEAIGPRASGTESSASNPKASLTSNFSNFCLQMGQRDWLQACTTDAQSAHMISC